ncbi:MAG: DinB family protein [Candidatus Heimdallarchaeota archaeon]|nr:DinB family protein [Candidatus Heimdallarchaeota archaeon]
MQDTWIVTEQSGETFQFLLTQMKLTRKYLLKEINGITQNELDFSPDINKFETIGTMLFHIADVENSWIFEHLDGQEVDFETWKWAFPLRLQLNPVQRTDKIIDFYLMTLEEVRKNVMQYLDQFSNENLSKVFESKMGKSTLEWVLFHIHRHEQHHIGQINLLRRLFKMQHD